MYALTFEILKFSAASPLLKHILRVFSSLGVKFKICGLDHFASEPFNGATSDLLQVYMWLGGECPVFIPFRHPGGLE